MKKIIRVAAVPLSLSGLLKGQLKFISQYYEVIGVCSPGSRVEQLEKQEGIPVIPVSIERKISLLKDIKSLYSLYKVFKKENPDIVHSLTPKAGLLSMIAARLAGVPFRLHTFTGLIFPYRSGLMQKILIQMDKLLCRCATNVYPESYGVKKHLEQFKVTKKNLKVLGNGNVNGVDLSYYNPKLYSEEELQRLRKSLGIDSEDFIYLFVGRLVGDKGINELVSAFKKISETNKMAKLVLVGPYEQTLDPLQPQIFNEIQNNVNIITTDWVDDVRPFFAIAQLFVFPSYREGFPNVVLQALAFKLPCIVTNISGSNEVIQDGINGFIIPTKNSASLFDKMKHFLFNPDHLQSMQQKTRTVISEKYERSFVWNCILEEYQLLEKSKHK